jgi:hypothetical protein
MRLLDQLAVPHRAVLLLHFVEDFSLEEIARITGTNRHGSPGALGPQGAEKVTGGE